MSHFARDVERVVMGQVRVAPNPIATIPRKREITPKIVKAKPNPSRIRIAPTTSSTIRTKTIVRRVGHCDPIAFEGTPSYLKPLRAHLRPAA
jgi:hypothetical protein